MPKVLCLTGLVIAILVFVLFFCDLLFGLIGVSWLAPFKRASYLMDLTFALCSAGLGYLSWTTWKNLG